jgi:Metallo-peptidase family M12/Reprolysin family propeptide
MRTSLIKHTSVSSLFPWLSLFWLPIFVQAQNTPQGVADWLNTYRGAAAFEPTELFVTIPETDEQNRPIAQAVYLEMDHKTTQKLQKNKPLSILLSIPRPDQPDLVLELVQSDMLAPGFSVGTLGVVSKQNVPVETGLHYRGIIRGNPQTMAAISIFPDEVMGMICDAQGTYTLGKLSDGSDRHVLYDTRDLEQPETHQCFTDLLEQNGIHGDLGNVSDRGVGCKTVQIYFECDYQMYLDRGSNTQNVVNYVTGLFNQVATLYANDNVGVAISEIYVWSSPDPHRGQSGTSGVLNSFRSARGTNFNGHLAHFLSTRNLGGGIA